MAFCEGCALAGACLAGKWAAYLDSQMPYLTGEAESHDGHVKLSSKDATDLVTNCDQNVASVCVEKGVGHQKLVSSLRKAREIIGVP